MRVAVLGAGGLMGAAILHDLAESPEVSDLTALDLRHGVSAGGLPIAAVDAQDRQALALALEGSDLLVNAASHRVNVAAMDAALMARCSYLDLGGLYHVTGEQLALDGAFAAAGLLAVLGCGAGPGKTNLMAAAAAEGLASVGGVLCASAGHDPVAPPPGTVALPYALTTLLDELREPAVLLREGHPTSVAPLTPGPTVRFPDPIGERATLCTLHSEAATLGDSLRTPDVLFALALAPRVELALRAHVTDGAPLPQMVAPSDRTVSAQVVVVHGTGSDGAPRRVRATAVTHPHDGRGGGVVSTAAVAPAVARLMARGALSDGFAPLTGVLPIERALSLSLLAPELEARGTTFTQDEEL